jgi:hypothetical protein
VRVDISNEDLDVIELGGAKTWNFTTEWP